MRKWIAGLMILAAGSALGATTWHVAPAPAGNDTGNTGLSWASPFATIQKGVNSAAVSGDTVLVSNGTGSSRVFNLSVAGSTLSGLTISNGYNNAHGAGVYMVSGTLTNCTVSGNLVYTRGSGIHAGGVCLPDTNSVMRNTIVYGNQYHDLGSYGETLVADLYVSGAAVSNSCAPELTHGVAGNITNAPQFVAAGIGRGNGQLSGAGTEFRNYDLHLIKGSLCIDAGQYQTWMAAATDLDEAKRFNGTPVDMGAYEFPPPVGTISMLR